MSREHDEAKLPKWVQERLNRARSDYRSAHGILMRGDVKEIAYYRAEFEQREQLDGALYRAFENAVWALPQEQTA